MSRSYTEPGQYGIIPDDIYLRKIAVSDYYEDPDETNQYLRGLMRDFRPDAPSLASDEFRSGDDRGGGYGSVERLSLRHSGARSEVYPDLPDGSFTDWEFMERDPRGIATGPDMRKHYEQQMARAAFIKKSPDDDYSVPEIGVNPEEMVRNVRATQPIFKKYFQNFDESMDSWHNGGTVKTVRTMSDLPKCQLDGTVMDITEATHRNKLDAVSRLSNDPTTAFRHSTPDHRVKIARYGNIRTSQGRADQKWDVNRTQSMLDHYAPLPINGEMANRMLADLIVDIERLRVTQQAVAGTPTYGDSSVNLHRKNKIDPDDYYKLMMMGVLNSHAPSANQAIDGAVNRVGTKPTNTRPVADRAIMNHEVKESMTVATQEAQREKKEDLRKAIYTSASDNGIYYESNNAPSMDMTDFDVTHNRKKGIVAHNVEQTFEVKNYGLAQPPENMRRKANTDYEWYAEESKKTPAYSASVRQYDIQTPETTEIDQDNARFEFGVYTRSQQQSTRPHERNNQRAIDIGDMARDIHTTYY